MAVKKDYYLILGVAPVASEEEIRKAYRMLSKKYHPDLSQHHRDVAEGKMRELVEAYNVLNDTTKRKEYDNEPQFQVKRFKKSKRKESIDQKPADDPFKKEPSIIERLISPFTKKKDDKSDSGPDYKQADVHFTLGLSMAEQEALFDQARNEFRIAIKLDPEFAEAYYNLGLMCYKLGDFDEARVSFQKVLVYNKDDQAARKMISLLKEPE